MFTVYSMCFSYLKNDSLVFIQLNIIVYIFLTFWDLFYPPTIDFILSDMDECVDIPGICENGFCKNFIGGYRCVCDDGFEVGAVDGNYGEYCIGKCANRCQLPEGTTKMVPHGTHYYHQKKFLKTW